jgi:hypothetical protein
MGANVNKKYFGNKNNFKSFRSLNSNFCLFIFEETKVFPGYITVNENSANG